MGRLPGWGGRTKKFFSCARWETVGGVADDIGVHVVGEEVESGRRSRVDWLP